MVQDLEWFKITTTWIFTLSPTHFPTQVDTFKHLLFFIIVNIVAVTVSPYAYSDRRDLLGILGITVAAHSSFALQPITPC